MTGYHRKISKESLCSDCLEVMKVILAAGADDYNYKKNGKYFKVKYICVPWTAEINYNVTLKCNKHRARKKKKILVQGCPSASAL